MQRGVSSGSAALQCLQHCRATGDGWWPDSNPVAAPHHTTVLETSNQQPHHQCEDLVTRSADCVAMIHCSTAVRPHWEMHSVVLFGLPARFEINSANEKYPEKKNRNDSAVAFGLSHQSRYLNISQSSRENLVFIRRFSSCKMFWFV